MLQGGVGGKLDRALAGIPQNCTWERPDGGECMVKAILGTYFKARDQGLQIDTIANQTFKVSSFRVAAS